MHKNKTYTCYKGKNVGVQFLKKFTSALIFNSYKFDLKSLTVPFSWNGTMDIARCIIV